MKKIYNPHVDNIKYYLIFFVALGHFVDKYSGMSHFFKASSTLIYTFHMPLFVLISGLNAKSNHTYNKKLFNRVVNLIVLYLLIASFRTIYYSFLYSSPQSLNLFGPGNFTWYLFSLSIWYLLTPLFLKVDKKKMIGLSFFIALIIGFDKTIGDPLVISRTLSFLPFYLIGLYLSYEKFEKLNKPSISVKILFIALAILITILIFTKSTSFTMIRPALSLRRSYYIQGSLRLGLAFRMASYVLAFIMGYAVMLIIPKTKRPYSQLGKRTMTAYLFHDFFVRTFVHFVPLLSLIQINKIYYLVPFIFCFFLINILLLLPLDRPIQKISNFNLIK